MQVNFFTQLPTGWKVLKFGEVAKITCGVAATPEYVNESVGIPFLSARNVQNGKLDLSKFLHIPVELHKKLTKNTKPERGDILLTRVGAGIGEAAVVDIDFEFSVYVSLTLIKCGKSLASEFVKSLLNTDYYRHLATRDQFAGGGVQNLNVQMVKEYPIPIPPLPEQTKIAQILSTWDKAITTTEQLLANSQRQKKALMQQLLTGKKRFAGTSDKWKTVKFGDVFKERVETGFIELPLLSITADEGVVYQDETGRKNTSNEDKSKYLRICPNDIGYNTMRMWQGRSSLSDKEGIVSPAYTIITPGDAICPKYASYLFKLPVLIHVFYRHSQGLVSDTWNLKFNHFKKITWAIPELEEQRKIAAVLSVADSEIQTLQHKIECLRQEKKALMQQLLTGKKRVQFT